MLVLTREPEQEIEIYVDPAELSGRTKIVVKVVSLTRSRARIGIEAPKSVVIVRDDAKQRSVPDHVS